MRALFLLISTCLMSATALAQPVGVFIAHTINVDPTDALAFAAVCATEYSKASGKPQLPSADAERAMAQANGDVAAAARAAGVSEYLAVELIRLSGGSQGFGSSPVMVSAVRKDLTGAVLYQTDLQMESQSDAPATCERIALSVVQKVPIEETRTVHNVTRAEANATGSATRIRVESRPSLLTSFGSPLESGYDPIGTLEVRLLLLRERYFAEVGLGLLIDAPLQDCSTCATTHFGYGGLTTDFGVNYFLNDGINAFFVGGGVMPRIIDHGSIFNFAPFVQVGGMLWRDSSTRLFGELRLAQNVLPVKNPGDNPASVNVQYPTELTFQVGMTL